MDEEMDKLRQAAYIAEVEYNRKQDAKRLKKDREERERKLKEAKIRKELLEACFDDEMEDVVKILSTEEVAHVEMADPHGNTLMSEAAAGGALQVVQYLISKGANPNTQGEFKRTPLWRACFLGHEEVVQPLLECGADPRITNEQGEKPEHVAGKDLIKERLAAWNLSETDKLVAQFESMQLEKEATAKAAARQELMDAEGRAAKAKEAYERDQKTLKKAHVELEKRISEYDDCVAERKPEDLIKVTLNMIKEAEETLETAKRSARESALAHQDAKAVMREKQQSEDFDDQLPGIPIDLKDLDDVLVKDVGNKVRDSGKWPLVIDPSNQASVFLRYLDTNYVNACSSKNMEPNRLRRSILGAFRYGKPCVLDFMDVDLMDEVIKGFDAVQDGLFMAIMTKKLMQNEAYMSLVRRDDGEEYHPNKFQDERAKKFKMIFLTSAREPNELLVEHTYPLRVNILK